MLKVEAGDLLFSLRVPCFHCTIIGSHQACAADNSQTTTRIHELVTRINDQAQIRQKHLFEDRH